MRSNWYLDKSIKGTKYPGLGLPGLGLLLFVLLATSAMAQLRIEVQEGFQGGVPITVLPFTGEEQLPAAGKRRLHQIIQSDLSYTGLFSIVADPGIQELHINVAPDYTLWLNNGVEKLVFGKVQRVNEKFEIHFELHDTIQRKRLLGQVVTTTVYGKSAHFVSDAVYTQLTGFTGVFQTRIAFVGAEHFGWKKYKFTLYVADIDGYNAIPIFASAAQLMSPAWSPDLKRIAYVTYEEGIPEIVIQTLANAQRERTIDWMGSATLPDWSSDGRLVYVSSVSGNPDVYAADLKRRVVKRLTSNEAVDTEPTWASDGSIIFTSDRSGVPQLYRIDPQGSSIERITRTGSYNSDADFSPLNNAITFLSRRGNGYVAVYRDLDTGKETELIAAHDLERPRFVANGAIVGYLNDQGLFGLVTLDGITGEKITAPIRGKMRGISWSPQFQAR